MKIYKIFILMFVLVLSSCESLELDLQNDPNNLTLEQSSPDFLLNGVQIDFRDLMSSFNGSTLGVMRYHSQFGTYANSVDNLTLNGVWSTAYRLRSNVALIKDIADSDPKFAKHYAIARILEAYLFATFTDFVGDIPFEQANNPIEFPNPEVSLGEDIYDALFIQIDEAIALLNMPSTEPVNDLFFDNGDVTNWTKVANTLKFKMYLNLRLINPTAATSGITNLINTASLIESANDDFQFQYSNSSSPVESRHPLFRRGYLPGGAGGYMSNGYMNQLINGKSNPDPRLRYYIYRQADRDPDQANNAELPCSVNGNPAFVYCYLGNFYWGRDHASSEGIPADGILRSVYGIYPAGGAFDDDSAIEASLNEGLQGAGILPILSSSYVKFMQAEAALMLGTPGNAASLLVDGITNSMDKVTNFASVPATFAATSADIQTYIDEVSLEYTNAADNDERLNIIMREYYLASFGYAIEAYNGYRRTGFPQSSALAGFPMQDPVETTTGFPRNFRYARDAVLSNTSLDDNTVFDKVFWDNNPDGFIE